VLLCSIAPIRFGTGQLLTCRRLWSLWSCGWAWDKCWFDVISASRNHRL